MEDSIKEHRVEVASGSFILLSVQGKGLLATKCATALHLTFLYGAASSGGVASLSPSLSLRQGTQLKGLAAFFEHSGCTRTGRHGSGVEKWFILSLIP